MVSLWPFGSRTGRIQDLKAPQLAEAALKSIQKAGRSNYVLRLLYRTLELDPYHPHALLILSELYRGKTKSGRPAGDAIYAGIILEYAMDRKSTVPADLKPHFDKARVEIMNQWGFVSSRSGEAEIDHLGYMAYINELMAKVHSVSNGFKMALTQVGIQAGIVDPVKGTPNRAYQEWLHADASTLHS
jgi:hypothetical protein